jgi:hypothetical protein
MIVDEYTLAASSTRRSSDSWGSFGLLMWLIAGCRPTTLTARPPSDVLRC